MTPFQMLMQLEERTKGSQTWDIHDAYWKTLDSAWSVTLRHRGVEARTAASAVNTLNSDRDADFITVWYTAWLTQKLLR